MLGLADVRCCLLVRTYSLTDSTIVLYEQYNRRMPLWADVRGTIHKIHCVIPNHTKQPLDRCRIVPDVRN
jgi:hypothetical protein